MDQLEQHIEAALREAAKMWPSQQYFEAHEVLEHVWLLCSGQDKAALGGLILLASALHKMRRQRHSRAARQIFARALTRLAPLPDLWRGVNLREMERATFDALRDATLPTNLLREPFGENGPAVSDD